MRATSPWGGSSVSGATPAMFQSHLVLLFLFSVFVATIFATLMRDDLREQFKLGALLFGTLVGSAIVLGWLMYPFPV